MKHLIFFILITLGLTVQQAWACPRSQHETQKGQTTESSKEPTTDQAQKSSEKD